jgi:hypothetical protein
MAAPVPRGPLAVRWHGVELPAVRAGAWTEGAVELENAGSATWHSRGEAGVQLSYHWLDRRGNPLVFDGERTALPEPVAPGERRRLPLRVRGPMPPGPYRLAVDLIEEARFWFEEVGNAPFQLDLDVRPRIERRLAARGGNDAALAAQDEPLVPDAEAEAVAYLRPDVAPAADWSRRVLDAHQEGYAVVGGALSVARGILRRGRRELEPWAPGGGRQPRFPHPLLCPSLVRDASGDWVGEVAGLPAFRPTFGEFWVFDGRIVAGVPAGRRRRA